MRNRERAALVRVLAELRMGLHYMSADGDNWDKGWLHLTRAQQLVAALVGDRDMVLRLGETLNAHEQMANAPTVSVYELLARPLPPTTEG